MLNNVFNRLQHYINNHACNMNKYSYVSIVKECTLVLRTHVYFIVNNIIFCYIVLNIYMSDDRIISSVVVIQNSNFNVVIQSLILDKKKATISQDV